MVHTKLYCPEQISIPENFPNILKDYAKAALRTQPYDLLRWSATYFRCLQMGIPPPVKLRYEKNVEHGSVTKEYLRVLIKQVGKGFFISRLLLQQRWDGLCLPKDELFKYLSLCRMLHWPQIHWLKLFAILVGTISKTPLDTLITLCELLTDNVDGAEAYVPIWMFRVCYKFLAELDCSEEQTFIDGRKLLQNGELEDEIHIKSTPEICSPLYLRNAVLEECRNRYTEAKSNENNVENSKMNEENNSTENQLTDRKSIASSENFEFSRINGWDRKRIIDSYADFDSIILLLREAQGAKLHEYDGPAKITEKHIRNAKCKQNEIMEERERQANMYEEAGKHEIYAQQIKIIKDLGPPWTWLHEFVSDHHCIDKSYNFIDAQSIISDATPIISSDESFDFDKEKPIADATSESEDEMTVISKQTSKNDDDGDADESFDFEMKANDKEQNEIEKLLEENTERIRRIESEEQEEYRNLGPCLRHLRSTLSEIGIGEGHIPETESVVSFLRKEAAEVLERAGEKYNPQVDLLEIAKILEQAHQKGVNFSNLDEMIDYIRKVYPEQKNIIEVPEPCESEQRNVDLTNVTKEVVEEECRKVDVKITGEIDPNPEKIEEENENVKNVDDQTKDVKEENVEEDQISNIDFDTLQKLDYILSDNRSEDEIKDIRIQANIKVDSDSDNESQDNSKDKDNAEKQELEKLEDKFLEKKSVDNIRDAFVADGIDADEHLLNEQISRELILGLIPKTDTPTVEEVVDEENEVEESVITATSSEISMLGNINDDSSLQPSTERSADTAIEREITKKVSADIKVERQKENTRVRPNAFQCKIPPIPGIGKTVKQETIRNFLTFLKGKSQLQNGMICPRNFKDPNCPDIVDCYD